MPNLFVKYNNMNASITSQILASTNMLSSVSIDDSIFSLVSYNNEKYIIQKTQDTENVYNGNNIYAVSIRSLEENQNIVSQLVSQGYSAYLPFPNTCHYIIYINIVGISSIGDIFDITQATSNILPGLTFSLDGIVESSLIPNDTLYTSQWYLNAVNAPTAWDITTGNNDITIAVLDTGIGGVNSSTGQDIKPKLVAGASFVTGESDTLDANGHGTQCAHLIGAITNNNSRMAGVAWLCRLAPVKVLGSSGNGSFSSIAAGILWAANNNCDVLSLSLASGPQVQTDPGMISAIDYAISRNCVIVVASGNSGPNGNNSPANCHPVISVGATDSSGQIAAFSSYQNGILGGRSNNILSISAPGASILTINHQDIVSNPNGTSLACPIVAGCCALIKSINRALNHNDIKDIVQRSTGNTSANPTRGFGLLNIRRALELAQQIPQTPTPTPTRLQLTPTPTPTNVSNNPCNSSAIIACLPNPLLRANPSANKICFRVGGNSCCNVDGFPLYSNEVCVNIPPPPPPVPSATPLPCIPSLANGPFTMDIVYESALTSGSIPCGQGTHVCNRTLFDVYVNNMLVGTANLNNANNGGSRTSSVNIPTGIISGTSFTFELRCPNNNCHSGVAIVRVFDNTGTRIYQSCVQNGVVALITECPPSP
jgi:subtilisin family serine protease